MATVIGIDVGGTKIAAGLVEVETGRISEAVVVLTLASRPPIEILRQCVAIAADLADHAPARPVAIGIGVCELVGRDGRITSANSFDWRTLDVAAVFAALGPCRVESDMRAAARAESCVGAGASFESFLYAGVGTGAACALVDGGVVRVGARGNAMYLGTPALEPRSGGAELNRRFGADLDGAMDDPAIAEAIARAAADVGEAIGIVVNAVDPDAVVVGGGLGTNERYFTWLEAAVRATIYARDTAQLPIVRSTLGGYAGVIGAAMAAWDRL